MYLRKTDSLRAVTLPDGTVLTQADLPSASTKRWVASRKLAVVRGVVHGLISQEQAQKKYGISKDEFSEWLQAVSEFGEAGLKVTVSKPLDNFR
ncbi:MAG: DUF1153 domain-containing protein [Pseudomonadota bacterium]